MVPYSLCGEGEVGGEEESGEEEEERRGGAREKGEGEREKEGKQKGEVEKGRREERWGRERKGRGDPGEKGENLREVEGGEGASYQQEPSSSETPKAPQERVLSQEEASTKGTRHRGRARTQCKERVGTTAGGLWFS